MSSERKSMFDWAIEYVGDPASFHARGDLCLRFLRSNGMKEHHRVLDLGCGALSQGIPLIRYLNEGCYVGCDPNGWLIEAALAEYPDLEAKQPRWSFASDFDIGEHGPFDYVITHSVLSHVAHWQLEQALINVRRAVNLGAVWLASIRLDQYDLGARRWLYPDVSYFRLDTVRTVGFHAGWQVEPMPDYRQSMSSVCPSDVHDWLRLTAVESAEERNLIRLDEEARQRQEEEIIGIAEQVWHERTGTGPRT